MRPKIGITSYFVKKEELNRPQIRGLPGQDLMVSTMDYSRSVLKAGGLPLPIPLIDEVKYINEIVKEMDGFILAGGTDVNPMNFNAPIKSSLKQINPERDRFELRLLSEILAQRKPVLGICRGFQLINVFFGGSLYQDIGENDLTIQEHFCKMLPKYSPCHPLKISTDSKLYSVMKNEELLVNSFHHQAINDLGEGLQELGSAKGGVIELIEHKDYPFLMAVQWHPEMMADKYPRQLKVFKLLIENC